MESDFPREKTGWEKSTSSAVWKACFLDGVATANFLREMHGFGQNEHIVDVMLGDRVQVFEENGAWYRGVVGCRPGDLQKLHTTKDCRIRDLFRALRSFQDNDKSVADALAHCRFGIFPRNIVHALQPVDAKSVPESSVHAPQISTSPEATQKDLSARDSLQMSDLLWRWKDVAFTLFTCKREQDYIFMRQAIVNATDLSKRLLQRLELVTDAERDCLLSDAEKLILSTNERLGEDLAVFDPKTKRFATTSESSVIQLYTLYKNATHDSVGSVANLRRMHTNTDQACVPTNGYVSVFPALDPASRLSSTCHFDPARFFDIVSNVFRIKWSNFILHQHNSAPGTANNNKLHKSSSAHSTLAAVTSDGAGNYICLEFAVSLYNAKTNSFFTEPVRHTMKLPLIKAAVSTDAENDITTNHVQDIIAKNADMNLNAVFVGLSLPDFSKNSDSIHAVIVVSRIFGDVLASHARQVSVENGSSLSNGTLPSTTSTHETFCAPSAEHDYSSVKIAIGCAVSRNLLPYYDFMMLPNDPQVAGADADRLPLFESVDVKTSRGIETLEPAISLSYFTLDTLSAKEKPNISRLLQHIIRQPRFSSHQPLSALLYASTKLCGPTSAPHVPNSAGSKNKNDVLSSHLCGGNASVVTAAVDTDLYLLPITMSFNLSASYLQQNLQPLDADREKDIDFVLTWQPVIAASLSKKPEASAASITASSMPLRPYAGMPMSRQMMLNQFVLPEEYRNDVYVTIDSLDINLLQHAILSTRASTDAANELPVSSDMIPAMPKNFHANAEILLRVCNRAGRVIQNAIAMPGTMFNFNGSNSTASHESPSKDCVRHTSYYSTVVYWNDETPKWSETVRLSLSPAEIGHAHLRFVVRLRNKKHSKQAPQQHFFPHSGSDKLSSKSTPMLKYFGSFYPQTAAKSPGAGSASSSFLSAPLKNDLILGVAYLPLAAGDSGCAIQSGSYDLFVHRLTGSVVRTDAGSPPSTRTTDRQSTFLETGRRLFKSRKSGLFANNKIGRSSSNSHRSVSPRTRSSTSMMGTAKRSSSPSIASLASVDESVSSETANHESSPPLPPPRYHHHLHTQSCELDTDYLALPADYAQTDKRANVSVNRKSFDDGALADANKGGTPVLKSFTTTVIHDDCPNGDVGKPRQTKHVFAGIPMPTFGRSSKKKVLAAVTAAGDAGVSVADTNAAHVGVDLAAGDLVMPDIDRTASNPIAGPDVFKRGVYATSSHDKLKVHVDICSTKAVHNSYLLCLFRHAQSTPTEIESSLLALISSQPRLVEFQEVLQFLPDILDALFDILQQKEVEQNTVADENNNSQLLAYKAITSVISLFVSEKFRSFMPSLESYMHQHFYYPLLYRQLLKILHTVFETYTNENSSARNSEHGYVASNDGRGSISKATLTENENDSGFNWGMLARQRSSRSSIFYRDFVSIEQAEGQDILGGRRSVDILTERPESDVVNTDKLSENIIRQPQALKLEHSDLVADTIKVVPHLLAFVVTSYFQHKSYEDETSALVGTPKPAGRRKSPRLRSPSVSSPIADAAASVLPPTPPPRTTSRAASRNSTSATPTIMPKLSTDAAGSPPYDICQQIQSLFLNSVPLAKAGQSAVILYQSILSVLPACVEMLTPVCSPEILFSIVERQLTVAYTPNSVAKLTAGRRSGMGQPTPKQNLFECSGGEKAGAVTYTPVQFLTLSTARLTFLKRLLGDMNFLKTMLSANSSTFLDNVDKLCGFVVEELDVSRANMSVTNLCVELITLLLETSECELIRNATLPPSPNSVGVRSFADLLVVKFFPVVVENILHFIRSYDDESGGEAARNESLLPDFLVILMSLLRFMNGINLQATVSNASGGDIAQLRQYTHDKLLLLVNLLLDRTTCFNKRWSLLLLEQCKFIHKFLLLLLKLMKKHFLPVANVVAADVQSKKPSVTATRSTVHNDLEGGDVDDEDDSSRGIDVELWIAFINTCVNFCLAEPLQIEPSFPTETSTTHQQHEDRALKTLLAYGDMRLRMSSALYGLWYSFGQHRAAFIPSIVYPVLRLSLIPHPLLRARVIPLFFDMMQNEFYTFVLVPYDVDDEAVDYVQRRQRQQQLKNRKSRNSGDGQNMLSEDEDNDFADDIDLCFENDDDYADVGMRKCVKTNFDLFAQEMFTRIDDLLNEGFGDWVYLRQFREAMSIPLDSGGQSKMFGAATSLIERLCQQIAFLLRYREKFSVGAGGNGDTVETLGGDVYTKIASTYAVMDFYDQIERHELYIRYLYRLRDLHLEHNDFTEIAFTLEHHAKLLAWSDEPLPEQLQPIRSNSVDAPQPQMPLFFTHRQLKEDLFREMIECFERSKLWEFGIQMCKELAVLYENDLYDYENLSQILNKQASLFENIVEQGESRPVSNYFYVGFWGRGFDDAFRNLHFIYRGAPFESLMQFQQRMRERFPRAEMLTSMNEPSDDIKDGDDESKQYLQICRVEPISHHLMYGGTSCGSSTIDRIEQQQDKAVSSSSAAATSHVSWKIRKFYEHNEVSMFTYSQVLKNPPASLTGKNSTESTQTKKSAENPAFQFARMWIERTTFATKTTLPYLLRWSEVRYQSKTIISPCKTAVENVQAKSRHVTLLAEKQVDALQQRLKLMQRTSLSHQRGDAKKSIDHGSTLTAGRSAATKSGIKNSSSGIDLQPNGNSVRPKQQQQPPRFGVVLIQEFTQTLLGVLDPAVQGGIPMYEQAFLSADESASGNIDFDDIEALKTVIAETVPILEVALTVHEVAIRASGAIVQQQQKGLQEHLVEKFHHFKASAYSKYGERPVPPLMFRLLKDAVNAYSAFEAPVINHSRILRGSISNADDVSPYSNVAVRATPRDRSSTNATDNTQFSGGTGVKLRSDSIAIRTKCPEPANLTANRSKSVRYSSATSGYVSSSSAAVAAGRRMPAFGVRAQQQQQGSTLTSAQSFISANNVYSTSRKTKSSKAQQPKLTKDAGDPKSLRKPRKTGPQSTAVTESSSSSGAAKLHDFGTLTRAGKVRESVIRVTKQTQNAAESVLSTFKRHLSSAGPANNNLGTVYHGSGMLMQQVAERDEADNRSLSMLSPNRLSHILASSSTLTAVSGEFNTNNCLTPNNVHSRSANRRRRNNYAAVGSTSVSSTAPSALTAAVSSSSSSSNNLSYKNKKAGDFQTDAVRAIDTIVADLVLAQAGSRASIVSTTSSSTATPKREDGVANIGKYQFSNTQRDAMPSPILPPKAASVIPPPPPLQPSLAQQRCSAKPPVAAKPTSLANFHTRLARPQPSTEKTSESVAARNGDDETDSVASAQQLPLLPDKMRKKTRTVSEIRPSEIFK